MSQDETRVFKNMRLEQILTKLEVMDARLQRVEVKIEERSFDTKPIWERALGEIIEVRQDIATLNRKIDVFSRDMLNLRADQLKTEERVDRLG